MRLIIIGVVLDVIAVLIIGVLIFVPLFVNNNDGLNSFYARLFCEPGDRYVPETTTSPSSDGGTSYSLYAVCVGERGTVDVTPKQTIIGLAAFAVPLGLAILLQVIGAKQVQHRRNLPREVTHLMGNAAPRPALHVSPSDNPIGIGGSSWPQQPGVSGHGRTLSEKLAEVDDAYDARRITREEYETLRKRIIDETNS